MIDWLQAAFDDPILLSAWLLLPLVLWGMLVRKRLPVLVYSSIHHLKQIQPPLSIRFRHVVSVFRVVVLALLVLAIARPHSGREDTRVTTEGIDIMLAVDVSTSMRAEDFNINGERANRLEAARDVIRKFVKNRKGDRIGLVVFSGRAYTQCPMTLDYGVLLKFLDRLKTGMIEDGTAIGSAISAALMRLKESRADSRMIILLTDGSHNAGSISPETAAEAARALGIKIYTVGAGTTDFAPYPFKGPFGNTIWRKIKADIDDALLDDIARTTGGKYFRATDTRSLENTYDEINRMEKTKVEVTQYMEYIETFPGFVIAAILLLLVEQGLAYTRYRILP